MTFALCLNNLEVRQQLYYASHFFNISDYSIRYCFLYMFNKIILRYIDSLETYVAFFVLFSRLFLKYIFPPLTRNWRNSTKFPTLFLANSSGSGWYFESSLWPRNDSSWRHRYSNFLLFWWGNLNIFLNRHTLTRSLHHHYSIILHCLFTQSC